MAKSQLELQQQIQDQVESEQLFFENFNDAVYNQQVEQQQAGEGIDDLNEVETQTENPENSGKTEEEQANTENTNTEEPEEIEEVPIVDEVNKRHGIELQYELPDDVLPDSPEGLYIRDLAFKEVIKNQTIEEFKERFPTAFKLALHEQAGGTFENFKTVPSIPAFEEVKDNLEVQKSLYLRSLKEKGMDDDEAQTLLDTRIKKNNLATAVEKYLGEVKQTQDQELANLQKQAEDHEAYIDKVHDDFSKALTSVYNTKVFPILTIPDSKVSESYNNFAKNIVFNEAENKFEYRVAVTNDTVKNLIQMNYIMDNQKEFFKQKETLEKQAGTRTLQRTQQKIEKEQAVSVKRGLDKSWLE